MRLTVTRHGKAERDSDSGLDRDRVLRPRGERQADFLGRTFAALDHPPTLVVSSTYARAWQTAERIASALGLEAEGQRMLTCEFGVTAALQVARACAGRCDSACIVGHNPTFEGVVARLTGDQGFRLRTGEAALIEVEFDDSEHDPVGAGTLLDVIRLIDDEE